MASKSTKGEILAKFFDDGEYTALFADGAVSAACGYAAGQQAYAVYQNGEAVTVKSTRRAIIWGARLCWQPRLLARTRSCARSSTTRKFCLAWV